MKRTGRTLLLSFRFCLVEGLIRQETSVLRLRQAPLAGEKLFCHLTSLLSEVAVLFCYLTTLFCQVEHLFCYLTSLLSEVAVLFCYLTTLFCQVERLFCYLTSLLSEVAVLFCYLTSMLFDLHRSSSIYRGNSVRWVQISVIWQRKL